MKRPSLPSILAILAALFSPSAPCAVVYGPAARTEIESLYAVNGGTFEDFEARKGELLTTQLSGVAFATTLQRFPSVQNVNLPVAVLPYGFLNSPSGYLAPLRSGNIPDGQSVWEITFATPQRWVGLVRNFNTSSLTRFYSGAALLATHQNTANSEFVGWVAESADVATWVTRIVMDGNALSGSYQVGYGDDLFFGTAVPEPSSMLLAVATLTLFGSWRRRRAGGSPR